MKNEFMLILLVVAFCQAAKSESIPCRLIDEIGGSGIRVIAKSEDGVNEYKIEQGSNSYAFRSSIRFGDAFTFGSKNQHFVWLSPRQEQGKQFAAYVSLRDQTVTIIDYEKILKTHGFIPVSRIVGSSGKVYEYWNIGEWSYSDEAISVQCRLNPNHIFSGLIFYYPSKKSVKMIDLEGSKKKSDADYTVGSREIPCVQMDLETIRNE